VKPQRGNLNLGEGPSPAGRVIARYAITSTAAGHRPQEKVEEIAQLKSKVLPAETVGGEDQKLLPASQGSSQGQSPTKGSEVQSRQPYCEKPASPKNEKEMQEAGTKRKSLVATRIQTGKRSFSPRFEGGRKTGKPPPEC